MKNKLIFVILFACNITVFAQMAKTPTTNELPYCSTRKVHQTKDTGVSITWYQFPSSNDCRYIDSASSFEQCQKVVMDEAKHSDSGSKPKCYTTGNYRHSAVGNYNSHSAYTCWACARTGDESSQIIPKNSLFEVLHSKFLTENVSHYQQLQQVFNDSNRSVVQISEKSIYQGYCFDEDKPTIENNSLLAIQQLKLFGPAPDFKVLPNTNFKTTIQEINRFDGQEIKVALNDHSYLANPLSDERAYILASTSEGLDGRRNQSRDPHVSDKFSIRTNGKFLFVKTELKYKEKLLKKSLCYFNQVDLIPQVK